MLRSAFSALVALLILSACRPPPPPDLREAVIAALAPEVSAQETRAALSNLSTHAPRDLIAMNLGTNNFTTFLLTHPADSDLITSGRYHYELPDALDLGALSHHLSLHLAVAASPDLRDLTWSRRGDHYEGSFSVETPYGLRASFLFEAEDRAGSQHVRRLVVRQKGSDRLDAGFVVFRR